LELTLGVQDLEKSGGKLEDRLGGHRGWVGSGNEKHKRGFGELLKKGGFSRLKKERGTKKKTRTIANPAPRKPEDSKGCSMTKKKKLFRKKKTPGDRTCWEMTR